MKVVGFILIITALITIVGCGKELSDQEIHEKFESVLGHDIPDKFTVTHRYSSPLITLDDLWEYTITYEENEFVELMENIDKQKWKKSREVLKFTTEEHPYVYMQIIPKARRLDYTYIIY